MTLRALDHLNLLIHSEANEFPYGEHSGCDARNNGIYLVRVDQECESDYDVESK